MAPGRPAAARGFTLVELLVALFAMALLAVMSWRGLDGMTRVQAQTESRSDEMLALQVGLAQWRADLDALIQLPQTPPLDWNGHAMRLTRRAASATDGVQVVAWTQRVSDGVGAWWRWQSPPVKTRGELETAWRRADVWSQNRGAEDASREVAVMPLDEWQIFFFRGDAWTHPQSSAVAAAGGATTSVPDGVRLALMLPQGQAVSGRLMIDWVRPTLGGNKP